ncbi:hypothetical protein GCM10017673_44510 [Streptosporangium violaceochromogenes]|nr:hypothetical protein GCM10017673_44510 [Streptosporangium violaceochromogenes]
MGVSQRVLAAAVAAVVAGGALTAASPAGATTPRSPHGAESAGTTRAVVTDIGEVVNQLSGEYTGLGKGETGSEGFDVAPNGRWTGSMWVPWVGNDGEIGKSIVVYRGIRAQYWLFQDYWDTADQIRYSTTKSYQQSVPVPGSSTGGGRKRLIVRGDGSLFLEKIN